MPAQKWHRSKLIPKKREEKIFEILYFLLEPPAKWHWLVMENGAPIPGFPRFRPKSLGMDLESSGEKA